MINIGVDFQRIKTEYYEEKSSNIIAIEETNEKGKAKLTVTFPNQHSVTYYKLCNETSSWLNFAINNHCADGIIIGIDSNVKARIYIFELKSKITAAKWSTVLKQYRGSILRALSFCHTIGIREIEEVRFYTSFIDRTQIDKEKFVNEEQKKIKGGIISRKQMLGRRLTDIEQWDTSRVKPFPNSQFFTHKTITLTKSGGINTGSYTI